MESLDYLKRIAFEGSLEPTLNTLQSLQSAHLFHVPFENLDIHSGIWINPAESYLKVVVNKRGGFCYELNGLFIELLKQIGFNAWLISGRVFNEKGEFGDEFDHMAIIVLIDDLEYLVDVGFGEFSLFPLEIKNNNPHNDPRGKFFIEPLEENHFLVLKQKGNRKIPQYRFSTIKRQAADFLEMCAYHQTSPNSLFTKKRLCSIPLEQGRITLTDNVLQLKDGQKISRRTLQSEIELGIVLKEVFGIE